MLWTVACHGCGQTLRVHDGHEGRVAHCPFCEAAVSARPPAPAAPPRAPVPRRRWLLLAGVRGLIGLSAGAGFALSAGLGRLRLRPAPTLVPEAGERPTLILGRGVLMPRGPGVADQAFELLGGIEVPILDADRPPPRWRQAGEVPPCLAVVADADRGLLLTATADGELCWFARRDYRRLGSVRLPQVAYQLALDRRRGLLYAASTDAADLVLAGLGDRDSALGDIHAYDVSAILRGETPTEPLRPQATYKVGGHITALLLTDDGGHLYYLSEGGDYRAKQPPQPELLRPQASAFVGRIVPADQEQSRVHPLWQGGPVGLTLAPDGRMLYVLGGSRVIALDPDRWTVPESWPVGAAVYSVTALGGRRILLLERRPRPQLILYGLDARLPITRWQVPFDGRLYVHLAPGGERLYLGSSAVTRGQVLALDVRGDRALRPEPVRQAVGNPRRLLRGPLFLTADGGELVTGGGHVFRAAQDDGRAGRAGAAGPVAAAR